MNTTLGLIPGLIHYLTGHELHVGILAACQFHSRRICLSLITDDVALVIGEIRLTQRQTEYIMMSLTCLLSVCNTKTSKGLQYQYKKRLLVILFIYF